MRSIRALSALTGAVFTAGIVAGCGGGRDEPASLAKLEPPPASTSAAPKRTPAKPMPPPKHGSPPRGTTGP